PDDVTLVIPARNSAGTIRPCLEAVVPLKRSGAVSEIIVVDDKSTDETRQFVSRYPVRCLEGPGLGAGGARNVGWRAASTSMIWFVDSDCVAHPEALAHLLRGIQRDDSLGGIGGSYGNMRPDSLL